MVLWTRHLAFVTTEPLLERLCPAAREGPEGPESGSRCSAVCHPKQRQGAFHCACYDVKAVVLGTRARVPVAFFAFTPLPDISYQKKVCLGHIVITVPAITTTPGFYLFYPSILC